MPLFRRSTHKKKKEIGDLIQTGLSNVGGVLGDVSLRPIGVFGRKLANKDYAWYIERALLVLVFVRFGLYIVEVDYVGSVNGRASPVGYLWAERCIASVFTLEYFTRWMNDQTPRHWPKKPTAIIDLLSILPFWVGFFVPYEYLGIVRAMRCISLLKLYRYSPATQAICKEVWVVRRALLGMFYFNLALMLIGGAAIYEIEHATNPEKFRSLRDGMWWSTVTSSSIDPGNMVPETLWGQTVAVIIGFVSIAFMSGYIGVFVKAVDRAFDRIWPQEEAAEAGHCKEHK